MVLEAIREFNHTAPFRPYLIRMASGEAHRVEHPDFVSISPRGSYVIVIDQSEHPHHLSTLLIEEAALTDGSRPRRSRKRAA